MATIIGDPDKWFFQNPNPPLREGDRVRLAYSAVDAHGHEMAATPGTVLGYFCTSPRMGDQYHVQLDGYSNPITFPLAQLELVEPRPEQAGQDDA